MLPSSEETGARMPSVDLRQTRNASRSPDVLCSNVKALDELTDEIASTFLYLHPGMSGGCFPGERKVRSGNQAITSAD